MCRNLEEFEWKGVSMFEAIWMRHIQSLATGAEGFKSLKCLFVKILHERRLQVQVVLLR